MRLVNIYHAIINNIMASVTQAILTVGGSTTAFLPLPSAWPSGTDCTSNLYLHTPIDGVLTFLAWDPLYGASMVLSAQSCLPPQVSNWWSQPVDESIYTALGPTFVCPEAYSAVQTAVVSSSLLQTFCCPSYVLLFPFFCWKSVTASVLGQRETHKSD